LAKGQPGFSGVVTATTRKPRPGEINGVHYHFMSPDEFRNGIACGQFLEWTRVHGDSDERYYGTPKLGVTSSLMLGRDVILNVDVKGADSLRALAKEDKFIDQALATVFLRISPETMAARLRARGKESEEEITRRIATAETELREAAKFDFIIDGSTRNNDFAALLRVIDEARLMLATRRAEG
jgi:guanylate kinase